ncbi:MAG: DNA recombination protein RmuC [Candidatus Limnocylindria bacterium]
MEQVVAAGVAMVVGLALGWGIERARRPHASGELAAAKATSTELRGQLERESAELGRLRQDLQSAIATRAGAEARVDEVERRLAGQQQDLEDATTRLNETFRLAASEALRENRTEFMASLEGRMKDLNEDAVSVMDAKKIALEGLLDPLKEALDAYRKEANELEVRRKEEVGAVGAQYKQVANATSLLQQEAAKLNNALRSPQVRGRWGQITLRRTAELAGMAANCDFIEQPNVAGEDGRLQPDMLVRLPSGREVVVDSKVPLDGFLDALEATTESDSEAALDRHVRQTKEHVARLSSKDYQAQFAKSPEFVVLFIPNDSFLAAAADRDPMLIENALARNIVLATPATFVALLRAVAYGWRQAQVADSARQVGALGQRLFDRMGVLAEHFERVGSSLNRAVESYNQAVGSLETRVLPAVRRMRELGVVGPKDIRELQPIERSARPIFASLVPEGAQGTFPDDDEDRVESSPTSTDLPEPADDR